MLLFKLNRFPMSLLKLNKIVQLKETKGDYVKVKYPYLRRSAKNKCNYDNKIKYVYKSKRQPFISVQNNNEGIYMSGKTFNKIYYDSKFVKYTNEYCCDGTTYFMDGLNKNDNGISFSEQYDKTHLFYMWDVSIPDNAKIYINADNTYEANILYLSNMREYKIYDKSKVERISQEILIEYLKMDNHFYINIPNDKKTMEQTKYITDMTIYKWFPDEHKTVTNTIAYLCSPGADAKYVPISLMNYVINEILAIDGCCLKYIEFKNKTYENCDIAVKQNGNALQYVPLIMMNYQICENAVLNNYNAYKYVPNLYRIKSMQEKMVSHNPKSYALLNECEITHNMMMSILNANILDIFKSTNENILNLIDYNIIKYYTCNPNIINIINVNKISNENAINLVKHNLELYKHFMNYSWNFIFGCVKNGVHFKELFTYHKMNITHDILVELVMHRPTIINEIPNIMLSDELFIIGMKYDNKIVVPKEFHTDKLKNMNNQNKMPFYESVEEIKPPICCPVNEIKLPICSPVNEIKPSNMHINLNDILL